MALRELPLLLKYTHNHVGMPTHAHLRTCKHTHVRVHTCPHMHTYTHAYRTKYNSGRSWEIQKNPVSPVPRPVLFSAPRGSTNTNVSRGLAGVLPGSDGSWVQRQGAGRRWLIACLSTHHLPAQNSKDSQKSQFEPDLPALHKGLPVRVESSLFQ